MSNPIAYDAYEELADSYAAKVETKPHNAHYDKPAVLSLLPDVEGKDLLDAGCGSGAYSKIMLQRGAKVTGIDMSPSMLKHAKGSIGDKAKFYEADLSKPLDFLGDESFDVIISPLVLAYIEDLYAVFRELNRVLRHGGTFVFSIPHPFFDYQYFKGSKYFEIEKVFCEWGGFGKKVNMPGYRYPLGYVINSLIHSGFSLDYLLEPKPDAMFKEIDPEHYEELMEFPAFICIRAIKK